MKKYWAGISQIIPKINPKSGSTMILKAATTTKSINNNENKKTYNQK